MKKIILIFIILISLQGYAQESCVWQDGFYRYYVRLITDNIPASDFDKADFMNHLITNSNPSNSDLDFLNNSITEVSPSFPSSQTESLQKTVTVVSDYDAMDTFLITYTESIDLVEFFCEAELGIVNFDLKNSINIYPNPITENSIIRIDNNADVNSLKIYNISGILLYSETIENYSLIELSQFELGSGIFFFKFISDTLIITKKIISK